MWKLPSPTWPAIGAVSPVAAMSRFVASTHSASREIGTQTSVDMFLIVGPGRSATEPQYTSCALPEARALVGPGRPVERAAAEIGGDLAEPLGLLAHARVRAWNSTRSSGVSGRASFE